METKVFLSMDVATSNAIANLAIAFVVAVLIICTTVVIVKRGWPTRKDLSGLLDREPMWTSETTTTTRRPVEDESAGEAE